MSTPLPAHAVSPALDTLQGLLRRGLTGCLSARDGQGGVRQVYISQGEVFAALSPDDGPWLLRRLVNQGLIGDRQAASISWSLGRGGAYEELLAGHVPDALLYAALEARFRQNLADFMGMSGAGPGGARLEWTATEGIFVANVQSGHDSARLLRGLVDVLQRTAPLLQRREPLTLRPGPHAPQRPEQARLVELCEPQTPLVDLLAFSPHEDIDTAELVIDMISHGMLTTAEGLRLPLHRPPAVEDAYEVEELFTLDAGAGRPAPALPVSYLNALAEPVEVPDGGDFGDGLGEELARWLAGGAAPAVAAVEDDSAVDLPAAAAAPAPALDWAGEDEDDALEADVAVPDGEAGSWGDGGPPSGAADPGVEAALSWADGDAAPLDGGLLAAPAEAPTAPVDGPGRAPEPVDLDGPSAGLSIEALDAEAEDGDGFVPLEALRLPPADGPAVPTPALTAPEPAGAAWSGIEAELDQDDVLGADPGTDELPVEAVDAEEAEGAGAADAEPPELVDSLGGQISLVHFRRDPIPAAAAAPAPAAPAPAAPAPSPEPPADLLGSAARYLEEAAARRAARGRRPAPIAADDELEALLHGDEAPSPGRLPEGASRWLPPRDADLDPRLLQLFSDQDDIRGLGDGQFSVADRNLDRVDLRAERVELGRAAEAEAEEVLEAAEADAEAEKNAINLNFGPPPLRDEEARSKLAVAQDVLVQLARRLDGHAGAGAGSAAVQVLLESTPGSGRRLFSHVNAGIDGRVDLSLILSNLRRLPEPERRSALDAALVDLIDRALGVGCESLPNSEIDDLIGAIAGYQQRLGV